MFLNPLLNLILLIIFFSWYSYIILIIVLYKISIVKVPEKNTFSVLFILEKQNLKVVVAIFY